VKASVFQTGYFLYLDRLFLCIKANSFHYLTQIIPRSSGVYTPLDFLFGVQWLRLVPCNEPLRVESRGKLPLCLTKYHDIKGDWSGGIAPIIFSLDPVWRWVVSFTPRPRYPREKRPCYPLDRRLGGPQITKGKKSPSLPLVGIETL